jgi:hypothetical protein
MTSVVSGSLGRNSSGEREMPLFQRHSAGSDSQEMRIMLDAAQTSTRKTKERQNPT